MTEVAKVTRTSAGLVEAMFDSLDKLNTKSITPEEARAFSHTAKTIVAIAHLELESKKIRSQILTENGEALTSLLIEEKK